MDNSRCFGHNKGNYKCSKTTWWTQGKTQGYKAVFPPLSFNAPSFPTRNSDVMIQSGVSSMLFVFCAACEKRATDQVVENFQNTISHWKKRLYCGRTAAEAKRRCLRDYCWTSISVIPHLDEFLSRFLLLQIKEWKRREREACCGWGPGWANLKTTLFLCKSAPKERRWAGIIPPAAHPSKSTRTPLPHPQTHSLLPLLNICQSCEWPNDCGFKIWSLKGLDILALHGKKKKKNPKVTFRNFRNK